MFDDALKICGDVGAGDDQAQGQIGRGCDRFQNCGQSFYTPVVADEQEHEFVVGDFSAEAGALAAREASGDGKLDGVDAVENYGNIFAAEAAIEQFGGAVGDGGEFCFLIAVDDALEGGDRGVVGAAMQSARRAAAGFGHEWLLGLLMSEFAQSLKHCVDDDEVGVEAIDAGGQDEVEAQTACDAMPPTHRCVGDDPEQKFEEVRAGDAWHAMPCDGAGCGRRPVWLRRAKVLLSWSVG